VNVHQVNHVDVANRLRPVLLKLVRELRREIHSLGVTGGQVTLLVALKETPGMGVRELAAQERMSPAAISKAIAKLEAMGLVERTTGEDRRRVGLSLTPSGQAVLRSVRSRRTAWLAERLERLDPEDVDAIERALDPLTALMETDL
jgi:DNA-binding MarR family transcriptional regulator